MFPFSLVRSPELNLNLLRVLACVAIVERGSELRQLALQAIEFCAIQLHCTQQGCCSRKSWISLTVPSKRHRECLRLTTMYQ